MYWITLIFKNWFNDKPYLYFIALYPEKIYMVNDHISYCWRTDLSLFISLGIFCSIQPIFLNYDNLLIFLATCTVSWPYLRYIELPRSRRDHNTNHQTERLYSNYTMLSCQSDIWVWNINWRLIEYVQSKYCNHTV